MLLSAAQRQAPAALAALQRGAAALLGVGVGAAPTPLLVQQRQQQQQIHHLQQQEQQQQQTQPQQQQLQQWLGFAAAAGAKSTANVPEGHHGSDLSSAACHIGLGRRRDLTMRQDLRLYAGADAAPLTLADVFKGARTLLVGFPGGKVCTEQHIPGYVKAIPELKAAGVDRVVAVTVGDPACVAKWASDNGFDKAAPALQVLADRDASFTRALGLELSPESGPPCQRYAAVVDCGVVLRVKVEQTPGDLRVSDAVSMIKTFKDAYA